MPQKSLSPRAVDPRPARTREALYEAVRQLSADAASIASSSTIDAGGAPAMTVNSLARRAGVSRSAFYAQFADLDEFMVALLIDTFREIGTADVTARHDPRSASPRELARESLTGLAEHFRDRHAFYLSSQSWNLSVRAHQAIVAAFAAQVRETILALDDVPADVDVADTSAYIGGGLVTVFTAWVGDLNPASVPILVDRLLALLPPWLTRAERSEN